MKRVSLLVLASMLPVEAGQVLVRAGTLINCTMSEPGFSSATAQLGDATLCDVHPFRRPGKGLMGRGFYLVGQLSDFHDPGRFIGKGWIKLEFDRMVNESDEIAVASRVVAVKGYSVDAEGRIKGKGHPKRDLFGWLFPFLWPVKIVTLPMRGPRPVLKGEVQLTLRLLDDIAVPVEEPKQTAAATRPEAKAEPALRSFPDNPDIRLIPSFAPPRNATPSVSEPPLSGWRRFGEPRGTAWRQFGTRH